MGDSDADIRRELDAARGEAKRLNRELRTARTELGEVRDALGEAKSEWARLKKRVGAWFLAFLALLTGVVGVSLREIHQRVTKRISDQVSNEISAQFAAPTIAETLQKAASERASSIISERVDPEVAKFHQFISRAETHIRDSTASVERDVAELKKAAEYQRQFRAMQRLGDDARAGSVNAWNTLRALPKPEDLDLQAHRNAEEISVVTMFIPFPTIAESTTFAEDEGAFPTDKLVDALQHDKNDNVRARAAKLLSGRLEKQSLDGLAWAIGNDPNMWVRKEAVEGYLAFCAQLDAEKYRGNPVFHDLVLADLESKRPALLEAIEKRAAKK